MLMCVLRRARPRRVALTAQTESRHLRCVFFKLCVRYRRRGLGASRALYMTPLEMVVPVAIAAVERLHRQHPRTSWRAKCRARRGRQMGGSPMMNVTGDGFIVDGTHQRSSPLNESMMIVKTWRRRRRNRKGSSNPRHAARQPRCGIRPRARITNSLPMRLASSNSACSRALVSARYRGSTRWSDIAAGGTSIRYSVVASRLRVSFMERRTANVPRCAAFLIRKPSASRSYRE
mmetsp:Transcript_6301/g.21281  ORF Transcript_6301/g.21281 Transcript_6301/m.21281 type:complete len:233 (-) Transcript_6301:1134-1832(-)